MTLTPEEGRRLHVCLDGSWRVYVGGCLVATAPAPPDPRQLRARRRR